MDQIAPCHPSLIGGELPRGIRAVDLGSMDMNAKRPAHVCRDEPRLPVEGHNADVEGAEVARGREGLPGAGGGTPL